MPVEKGPISKAWWRVLECSLQLRELFVTNGTATTVFGFLKLKQEEPEAAVAIEKALLSERFSDVRVYQLEVTDQEETLVVACSRNQRELICPDSINVDAEYGVLLNARLKAEQGLLRFVWNEQAGWLYFIGYPALGILTGLLGLTALDASQYAAYPRGMEGVGWIVVLTGICIVVGPFVALSIKRWRIRSALKQIADATYIHERLVHSESSA